MLSFTADNLDAARIGKLDHIERAISSGERNNEVRQKFVAHSLIPDRPRRLAVPFPFGVNSDGYLVARHRPLMRPIVSADVWSRHVVGSAVDHCRYDARAVNCVQSFPDGAYVRIVPAAADKYLHLVPNPAMLSLTPADQRGI
jgi:hypothetical protein